MDIRVGIIGSTGYAGNELVRLLLQRNDIKMVWYGSHSYIGKRYSDVYRSFFQIVDAECVDDKLRQLAVFLRKIKLSSMLEKLVDTFGLN